MHLRYARQIRAGADLGRVNMQQILDWLCSNEEKSVADICSCGCTLKEAPGPHRCRPRPKGVKKHSARLDKAEGC